jgi:uncharacterized membrane protein
MILLRQPYLCTHLGLGVWAVRIPTQHIISHSAKRLVRTRPDPRTHSTNGHMTLTNNLLTIPRCCTQANPSLSG